MSDSNYSNFYLKAKLTGDGDTFKIPVEDTVYTICPGCGKEHEWSLADLHDLDLDCTVYCGDCTESREVLRKVKAAQSKESNASSESAFYVKGAGDSSEARTPFTGSVCTECANCGKEISVDLFSVFLSDAAEVDLEAPYNPLGGSWLCDECSEVQKKALATMEE